MNQEKAQRSSYHFCEPALISLPTQLSAAAGSVNRYRTSPSDWWTRLPLQMKVRWRVLNPSRQSVSRACRHYLGGDLVAIALPLLQIDTHGESAWDMLPAAAMPE